jgi:outer membrane lipoprotein SlyB
LIGGAGHHDHGASAAGAVFGAATGAVVGAAASQGSAEERWYEVTVRFDDGGLETFVYRSWPPFRVGDPVQLTQLGLSPA